MRCFRVKSNAAITASLVLAIFLWGGTNIGVKYLVGSWPPIWTGCSRLTGVFVLFWPSLKGGKSLWLGELLALVASILWTNYGRQCRIFGAQLSGVEITAQTMWRAAVLLSPLVAIEVISQGLVWRSDLVLIQIYCTVAGGVVAFVLWNNALRHWPTSQVFLFNNLIPLSTMAWANLCLKEPVTRTFGIAMILIVGAVILGQTNWQTLLTYRWMPPE